jgi:hypothetical protein
MFRWRRSTIPVLTLLAAGAACSHDWDAYDPRLDGGALPARAARPAPASTSMSTSTTQAAAAQAARCLPGHTSAAKFGDAVFEDVRASPRTTLATRS